MWISRKKEMSAYYTGSRVFAVLFCLLALVDVLSSAAVNNKRGKAINTSRPRNSRLRNTTKQPDNSGKPQSKSFKFIQFNGNAFLERFGYLDFVPDHKHSLELLTAAIREFQKFIGLKVTGQMDASTVDKMRQPRCAVPDKVRTSAQSTGSNPLSYRTIGTKWNKKELTYRVVSYTRGLSRAQQMSAFSNAFKKWSEVIPLTFRPVSQGPADMVIGFASGEHGDGYQNAFDGDGGVLAHAFPPDSSSLAGDTHFDDEEQWTMGTSRGINLEIVAAHEFGHALGLDHSSNPKALMAPMYQYMDKYSLHPDDVTGIQRIYGSRNTRSTPATNKPRSNNPRPTTKAPRPATSKPPRPATSKPDHGCSERFDALEQVHDGNIYAFLGDTFYMITKNGPANVRKITQVYAGAPSSPGAVVYDRLGGHTYFFKGNKYWRYTGYRRDVGYPRTLREDFHDVTAGLQMANGYIYLFQGKQFFIWTERLTRYSVGYPRDISSSWKGLTGDIDAAFRGITGNYYFFKHNKFWSFNANGGLARGFPNTVGSGWLDCDQGSKLTKKNTDLSFLIVFT